MLGGMKRTSPNRCCGWHAKSLSACMCSRTHETRSTGFTASKDIGLMQGCPSCEMAYMQQKGARKKIKYRITYNTLNIDLLDMGVPATNDVRWGRNLTLMDKAFGDLEMQKSKLAHVTARAFHESKSYIEALGAPARPEDFRVEIIGAPRPWI